jgi:multidrug efflux pump subunit AcrA (membrane-fusion protein)
MSLLGSLCGLWLTGNTINIMTLGGLALAIGILVDEATVEIENIHVQMGRTPSLSRGEHRLAALVDYRTITAPCNGVVLARNVNLGDFVQPASGDPSQGAFSLGASPNHATPLYVLNRIDPVLFVFGVPEADAAYVAAGRSARVRVPALANHEFPARVTRTSWALNPTSRTLMAQVELANPKGTFLPGMYAYGSVLIERPSVRAVPVSAVTQIGNQTFCFLALDGKAARTPAHTGLSDGTWVEVTGKLVQSARPSEGTWKAFDGSEEVIAGALSLLADGAPVEVAPAEVETKVGNELAPPVHGPANPHRAALAGQP